MERKLTLRAYGLNLEGLSHTEICNVIVAEFDILLNPVDIDIIINFYDLSADISTRLNKSETIPLSAYDK